MADPRISQLEKEIRALLTDQEATETLLARTRREREALKRSRKVKGVPTLARIAAYTRKVKRLVVHLGNVENGIESRRRTLEKLRKRAAGDSSLQGLAQRVLDHPRTSFPLVLSTGGTARRDFQQLAELGKVRVPATGAWIVPPKEPIKAILLAADRRSCAVNAYVGGVHSSGSKHYRGLAFDGSEDDRVVGQAVRENGGNTYDEDPWHDHQYFGPGGP